MNKIVIEDKENDLDLFSEEMQEEIKTLSVGQTSLNILKHITKCVDAVQKVKLKDLKQNIDNLTN